MTHGVAYLSTSETRLETGRYPLSRLCDGNDHTLCNGGLDRDIDPRGYSRACNCICHIAVYEAGAILSHESQDFTTVRALVPQIARQAPAILAEAISAILPELDRLETDARGGIR